MNKLSSDNKLKNTPVNQRAKKSCLPLKTQLAWTNHVNTSEWEFWMAMALIHGNKTIVTMLDKIEGKRKVM